MDFMNRSVPNQPQPARSLPPQESVELPRGGSGKPQKSRSGKDMLAWWSLLSTNALWFIVALLVASVAWLIFSSRPTSQTGLIDGGKLQAVFLNSGQVYFGNITALNHDYLVLDNVYYLQSSSSTTDQQNTQSNQNVSLIKLGCELHKPYDQMVVNASQVTFWENLQADGEVAKAVAQFQQQNPNGQKCSNQPAASSGTNLQNQNSSTNTSTGTNTNTNTNTTKKP